MVFIGVFAAFMDQILHSELPLSLGPLDYIFMSARMHQIHHSAEFRHRDKNFGGTLSVFDWIFGTAYRPAAGESFRRGLSDDELGERNPHRTLKAGAVYPCLVRSEEKVGEMSECIRSLQWHWCGRAL
jgi:sterol desaturase/sphingolipid hydroxylase (fatty acid hydroxylase superfamily)